MKKLKGQTGSLILSIAEILVGVLLLVNPTAFTSVIIIAVGILLLAAGIVNIVKYFRAPAFEAAKSQKLLWGLLALVSGVFCIFKFRWFIVTFPILTVLYGIAVLISGLWKVQWTVDIIRIKRKKWFLAAISAAVSIICAVVILSNPFTSTAVLWLFIGISLIVEAVIDIVTIIVSAVKSGKAEKQADQKTKEGESNG
ncbi:MAG: HdeD family acid-resistance protein [Candidatus Avispirillum sp.]